MTAKPRTISARQLKALGACREQLDKFVELFGRDPVEVTVALCVEHSGVFEWGWAARDLLSPEAQAEHSAKVAPLLAEHSAKVDALRDEYDTKVDASWTEYSAKVDASWAEYSAKVDALWAEYRAKVASLWAEYRAKRAEAFAVAFLSDA